ncbi:oxidoreductase yciK [Candidatus Photodesmus blepharus]|uniref:Oxidoreductase yciK n=1 Tax=Candidatus Photodesmus blepharonis TaxID=1179155 RepID=A0A084CN50_9GAMM|nr:YciK family oxidoreductase [Candidatus Photodesmus blepharus]KEY91229.1 oxidoreductase yciK [Candidatus Photodesmus blepharus]
MNYFVSSEALKDKVILVTGSSAGIGKEAAFSFASYGAVVILLGRTINSLEKIYDQIVSAGYSQPVIVPLDMKGATKKNYIDMIAIIEDQFGRLDGVLQNASILGDLSPFEQIGEDSYDDVMQINVKSQFLLVQAALPLLRKSDDARIIFTSSTVGHRGRAFWGPYAISKFATEGMMQVLADELISTSIRVNAINPGSVRTSMRAKAFPDEDSSLLKEPKDIMSLYLYLMAPEGKQVHGQCLDAQIK